MTKIMNNVNLKELRAGLPTKVGRSNPFTLIMQKLEKLQADIDQLKQSKEQKENAPAKFLTSKEVCEMLRISQPTRISLARQGKLIPMKVGRRLLYSPQAIEQALAQYSKWTRA